MAQATKSTTICFDKSVLELIHKQAKLAGVTSPDFMHQAVLEKLEDSLDYQDAVKNIRNSGGKTISREEVKCQWGW